MGVEKLIYDELIKFKQLEAIRPSENQKWKDSVLIEADNQRIESLLVEFNDIFTRYRLDIGYTYKFSVKLTTDTDRPEYSKTQRISIHLKDALLLELALLQYYGVITTLPFSRYSSPIFAKQKPNGNLRILVDLRKINHLIRNDNNTFSIATLADAGSHLSGTILLCKMDGSHGYFQVAMVDKKSVQLLGFNFASRTNTFHKIKSITNMEINKKAQPDISVSTAFLQQSPILFIVKLKIKIGHTTLDEEFLIFENLSSTLLGLPFFQRHKIILDPHNRRLHFPELTFQLNTMKIKGKGKQKPMNARKKLALETKEYIFHPGQQQQLQLQSEEQNNTTEQIGIIQPTQKFEQLGIALTSHLDKLKNNKRLT